MLFCGQVLSLAAMKDGFYVTWLPSYGPEMRGGAASCAVMVAEKPIGSPVVKFAGLAAVMSQPACDKYHAAVAQGGVLLYNSAIVTPGARRDDIRYIGIDFSRLAGELGNPKVLSTLVLGSLNELLKCVSEPALLLALEEKFTEKGTALLELNKRAVALGANAAKGL